MSRPMRAAFCVEEEIKIPIYSKEELAKINLAAVPKHIAFIPDGNRRWALKCSQYNSSNSFGHRSGADTLIDIVKAAKELGVKAVTFYSFSTENWIRPQDEVDALMWLFHSYLVSNRETMLEEGIRLGTIGDLSKIPSPAYDTILETLEATKDCRGIDMVLAINYGGRDEIRRAVKKIADDVVRGVILPQEITENLISKHMDTHPWGDPDLLIRTSGEMRISNFLIWQLSYAELHVIDVLWPEFTHLHLLDAISSFQKRERRLGN